MKKSLGCGLMICVALGLLVPAQMAWGWVQTTHSTMGRDSLVHSSTFKAAGAMLSNLYGWWDFNDVKSIGEDSWLADPPMGATYTDTDGSTKYYEDGAGQGQWGTVSGRGYWSNWRWGNVGDETRMETLIHIACDVATPGHGPTWHNPVDDVLQTLVEAAAAIRPMPDPLDERGISYSIIGPSGYLYSAMVSNANSYVSNYFNFLFQKLAPGWAAHDGMHIGRAFAPIVVQDYCLLNQQTICEAGPNKTIGPGGSITFTTSACTDPDFATLRIGPGSLEDTQPVVMPGATCIPSIGLDFQNDGSWEVLEPAASSVWISYGVVLNYLGLPQTGWRGTRFFTVRMWCGDDDGTCVWNPGLNTYGGTDTMTLYVVGPNGP